MAEHSCIALPLPEAIEFLERQGKTIAGVIVTRPPRARRLEGVPRVIRERPIEGGVELTVVFPVSSCLEISP